MEGKHVSGTTTARGSRFAPNNTMPTYPHITKIESLALPLPSTVPPINPQIPARHETTRITDQKHRRAPVLLGLTQSPQHVLRGPRLLPLGEPFKQLLHHGRHDVPGGDAVDADVMRAPLGGQRARELLHGGFGGIVGAAEEILVAYEPARSRYRCAAWGMVV